MTDFAKKRGLGAGTGDQFFAESGVAWTRQGSRFWFQEVYHLVPYPLPPPSISEIINLDQNCEIISGLQSLAGKILSRKGLWGIFSRDFATRTRIKFEQLGCRLRPR